MGYNRLERVTKVYRRLQGFRRGTEVYKVLQKVTEG